MSAFVPGLEYDTFVSYAHDNDLKLDSDIGWVETLVIRLREVIKPKLGRDSWRFYHDSAIRGHTPFPQELRESVQKSATLLAIFSQSYLDSPWCTQERELFLQAAEHDQHGADGRLFIVLIEEIDYHLRPPAFQNLRGYTCFEKTGLSGPPRIYGTPMDNDPHRVGYYRLIDDLARDLSQKLKAMKERS